MTELIIMLLVLAVGFSAYAQARRQGVWSWRQFAKAMLGAAVLIALAIGLMIWLGKVLGPERAGLVTLLEVFLIVAGVSVLALWLRPKPPRGPD
ncbi:MAG TPA: hypothetical protein VLT83_02220 [Opitutaceae bacterium]|nr:hypothetical protein [Opitutaceae bacterium]